MSHNQNGICFQIKTQAEFFSIELPLSGDGFNLAWKKHLLDALDRDGSGAISREEYRAALDLWDFTAGALFSDVVRLTSLISSVVLTGSVNTIISAEMHEVLSDHKYDSESRA